MTKPMGRIIWRTVFWVLVLAIAIYCLFPFYWALSSSFKSERQLQMTPATLYPRNPSNLALAPTLINYKNVLDNEPFMRGLLNSLIVAGLTTLLALIVGTFAAFALGKLRFPGKTPTYYLILSMTMFPQIAVLSGLFWVIRTLQIRAIPSMIISYMIFVLPFTVWVLAAFFRDLPAELLQAAQVDGATAFQTFYRILLPLTLPGLVTTGLLSFINAWNEYLFALTFTTVEPSARTVPVAIALFSGQVAFQEPFGQIMAATVVVTVPLIVLVLLLQDKIVAGLTAGAVKG